MNNGFAKFLNQKTTWAGIAGITTALAGYFTGDLTAMQAVGIAITALVGLFAPDAKPSNNAPVQDPNLPKAG